MKSIHHIAFNCSNISSMEQFYSIYFGFKRVRVFNEGTEKQFIMLRLGDTCIELFPAEEKENVHHTSKTGFKHVAFEVSDLQNFITTLNSNGIMTENIIDYSDVTPGFKISFLHDPEGNKIEIMEGYTDATK